MACGCSKRRWYSETDPLVIGSPLDSPTRVRFTVNFLGVSAGQDTWVDGDQVQVMIDNGWLVPL
jgi:hypothetical protein